jgi:hypothetical protein
MVVDHAQATILDGLLVKTVEAGGRGGHIHRGGQRQAGCGDCPGTSCTIAHDGTLQTLSVSGRTVLARIKSA